jgi:hypothetical protein
LKDAQLTEGGFCGLQSMISRTVRHSWSRFGRQKMQLMKNGFGT